MEASPRRVEGVAGMVLTGGASRRMGSDKATLVVDGVPLAVRTARILGAVVAPVVEVGTGCAGVPATREEPAGGGPLVAVAEGVRLLARYGHRGAAVVGGAWPLSPGCRMARPARVAPRPHRDTPDDLARIAMSS